MPVYLPGLTFGSGYGGAPYGTSPYGGAYFPRPPVPVTGGFGGSPYSYSSYGSIGASTPRISSAVSISGFVIRIFFSEEMDSSSANILDPNNYALTVLFGVPVTISSVVISSMGVNGATSVEITHTGTTLGGSYKIVVSNLSSYLGLPLSSPNNEFNLKTLGDQSSVTVSELTVPDGRTYKLNFLDSLSRAQNLLSETDFTPGVDQTSSYDVEGSYPVTPVITSATQNTTDLSEVVLEIDYLTQTTYNLIAGPANSINYNGSVLPEDDSNFTGVRIGTGFPTSSPTGLFLSKSPGTVFGYSFGDTSGKVQPNSSLVSSVTIDLTSTTVSPTPINETFATYSFNDGVVGINVLLRSISGSRLLEVVSGSYSSQIPCDWLSGPLTVSILRNQKGSFYSILVQGFPEATFSTTQATGTPIYSVGSSFVIASDFEVSLLKLSEVKITSTQTLFISPPIFLIILNGFGRLIYKEYVCNSVIKTIPSH